MKMIRKESQSTSQHKINQDTLTSEMKVEGCIYNSPNSKKSPGFDNIFALSKRSEEKKRAGKLMHKTGAYMWGKTSSLN